MSAHTTRAAQAAGRHFNRPIRERHIVHEIGDFWVADQGWAYTVFHNVGSWAVSDSSYRRDADGLSLAIARANYKARLRAAAEARHG